MRYIFAALWLASGSGLAYAMARCSLARMCRGIVTRGQPGPPEKRRPGTSRFRLRGASPLVRIYTACLLLLGALALALPVPAQAQTPSPSVCDRTSQVRDVIVSAVSGVSNCANITTTHLAAILDLEFSNRDNTGIHSLQSGDFAGLTGLEFLSLHDNNPRLSGRTLTLPADIFDGLTSLEELDLGRNVIPSLPTGVFDDLTALTVLNLVGGDIASVSANVFSRLSNLESLYLTSTAPTLPAGIFDGLTKLTELELGSSSTSFSGMTSIRSDLFDELTALESLELTGHNLSMLPADIFDNLARLTELLIGANGLTSLPAGIFNNLPGLTTLYVVSEAFSRLPPGIFDNVTRLTFLRLNDNRLQTLPDDLFERLTALQTLLFDGNPGTESFVPTAVAGDDQAVGPGAAVTLDATASGGAWGTNVTYAWTQPSGTPVVLTGAGTATPSFTAPDSPGDLEFELAVMGVSCGVSCQGNQPSALTSTDRVTINVGTVVSIEPGHLAVAEDAGTATLTVSLNRPAESALSVLWYTQDEHAEAPSDYTAQEGSLTFAAEESQKDISVPIVDDAVREDPVGGVHETFFVILREGQGYSRGDSYALVEIVDNDGDAPPDVIPPQLTQVTPNSNTLVLTYDETLDDESIPAPSDFVVWAAGSTVGVNAVSVIGATVTLTLATAVEAGQTVTVGYTPGTNPIQDAAGNDAAALAANPVTDTPDPDPEPDPEPEPEPEPRARARTGAREPRTRARTRARGARTRGGARGTRTRPGAAADRGGRPRPAAAGRGQPRAARARPAGIPVTEGHATEDGSAKAREHDPAVTGTWTIAAGGREGTGHVSPHPCPALLVPLLLLASAAPASAQVDVGSWIQRAPRIANPLPPSAWGSDVTGAAGERVGRVLRL